MVFQIKKLKAKKSVANKNLNQTPKGQKRAQQKDTINVMDLVRLRKADTAPPKKGRPSKLAARKKQFGWVAAANPFNRPSTDRPKDTTSSQNPLQFSGGKVVAAQTSVQFTARNVANIFKSKIPAAQKAAVAKQVTEQDKRDRFLKSKMRDATDAILAGDLMDSSFVTDLEYDDSLQRVNVKLSGIWYTYFNVPEFVFNSWWEGLASCTTDDVGGFTGRHKKMWIVGKTPSLGAFFNQHIKNIYKYTRGKV